MTIRTSAVNKAELKWYCLSYRRLSLMIHIAHFLLIINCKRLLMTLIREICRYYDGGWEPSRIHENGIKNWDNHYKWAASLFQIFFDKVVADIIENNQSDFIQTYNLLIVTSFDMDGIFRCLDKSVTEHVPREQGDIRDKDNGKETLLG